MIQTWYHGTRAETAKLILSKGVDTEAPKTSDPGDFGWGFYLTKRWARAKAYGEVVLSVGIDPGGLAYIANPYFFKGFKVTKPKTMEEHLFHQIAFAPDGSMKTVTGDRRERVKVSRAIREAFLSAGYLGILSDYDGGEVVLFDDAAAIRVWED